MPRLTYRQIADDLTSHIKNQDKGYAPGDELPSYRRLSLHYDVSVSTVQSALRIVRERGLIRGEQGRAIYVADPADA